MYYNQKHKEKIKERKDNYIYIGSYHYREITLDNKNTKNGAIIRVKCPYCSKEYDVRLDSFINKNKSKCIYCCNKYENSFAYYIQVELGRGLNEFCNINKIPNKYKIQKEETMEYKIWTLEEAKEDYKRTQIKKCCKNCKFYKKDVNQGWLGDFVDLCLVKDKEIYYDAKDIGQDCKYFNYID